MRSVIFDLDGVLIDSMPSHSHAWVQAFGNIARIQVDRRVLYVLEGMRGPDLAEKVLADHSAEKSLASAVVEEKNRLFKAMDRPKPFDGVREIIRELRCTKAVVSGSNRHDVGLFLEDMDDGKAFDVVISADDIERGKPDPLAFETALKRLHVSAKDAVVVENAPLGVRAANNAGILCYVALNTTLLDRSDFDGIIPAERIFEKTSSLKGQLHNLCQE